MPNNIRKEYYDMVVLENNLEQKLNKVTIEGVNDRVRYLQQRYSNKFNKLLLGGTELFALFISLCLFMLNPAFLPLLIGVIGISALITMVGRFYLEERVTPYPLARLVRVFTKGKEKKITKELELVRARKNELLLEENSKPILESEAPALQVIDKNRDVKSVRLELIDKYIMLNELKKKNKNNKEEAKEITRVRK